MELLELRSMSIFFSALICCFEVTRVGKRLCKPWVFSREQVLIAVYLSVFFAVGGIVGGLFACVGSDTDSLGLSNYLVDYLRVVASGQIGRGNGFGWTIWNQARYCLILFLLWWAAFGMIGVPFVFALRGFLMVFSICCFVRVFGLVGFLPALILFVLPGFLWGPAFYLLGVQGIRRIKRQGTELKQEELRSLVFVFGFLFLCGVFEYAVVPRLIKSVASIVL